MDEQLYKENILDHYHHPRNKREISDALKGEGLNANCGDSMTLFLKVDGDKISDASFVGEGCAVSLAGASMLTEKVVGEKLAKIKLLTPGDIYTMLGIHVSPARTNCALLSYEALNNALKHSPC